MSPTPTPQNEILTFAISFCKTFWGAPTSSVTISYNLNKRLFYNTTNLCKWQQYTKIILDTYLLTLTNVHRNPEEEVISMSFQEQSVTTYLLTRTNVNRNQEKVLSTITTTKTHARKCRQRLRMIDRTWCRRVGDEYSLMTRTKTTIDRTATMATTTPRRKQNDNWRRYRRRRHTPNSAKVRLTSKMLLSFVLLKVQHVHCFRVYFPGFVLLRVQKYNKVQNKSR